MSFNSAAIRKAAVALALAVASWNGVARATDYTWDLADAGQPIIGGDGSWSFPNDWTTDNGTTKTSWTSGTTNNAIFNGSAGTVSLTGAIIAGSLTFNTPGYKIQTGTNTLTLSAGGATGSGTIVFSGAGTLALKNNATTTFNVDVQATAANGKITVAQNTAGVDDTKLTIGSATIGATRALTFDGSNNYRLFTGDVTNGNLLQAFTATFNGAFIAGNYTGAGSGTTATDTINVYRGTTSTGVNHNVATDGSDVNGQGGIFFSGAGTRYVGNLNVAYASSGSAGYGGTFGAVDGAVVHVTKSYTQYRNSSDALVLLVRNGGQIIFDSGITYNTGYTGLTATLQTQLSGDGNPGNVIDYGGSIDLGKYISGNGVATADTNGNFVVGGLNLITRGTTFTNYKGINFAGIDDDGKKYGDITKTAGAGWTIKDNALTVTNDGGTVRFSNSRSLDIQAGDTSANGLVFQSPITIAAGKSIYKWGVDSLIFDTTSTVNSSGVAGAVYAREGTTIIRTATFKADLIVGGGSVTSAGPVITATNAAVYVPGASLGGALTVASGGQLHSSAGSGTQNLAVTGAITLQSGAEFDFNFNGTAHDSMSGAGLTVDASGSYTLKPNIITPVPASTYTLISGSSFSGGLGTWSISGNPAGWSIARNGNEIDLIVSADLPLPSGAGTWMNGSGDGKWTTNAGANKNWIDACPGAIGDSATFNDSVTGGNAGTVDLDGSKTLGSIVLNTTTSASGYTLGTAATADTLTLHASSGHASISAGGNNTHTINARVITASDTDISAGDAASLSLAGGISNDHALTLTNTSTGILHAGAITGNGSTTVSVNSIVAASRIVQNTLAIGGTALITPADSPNAPGSTSIINTLTIAGSSGSWTGQLDLGNSAMVIRGGGAAVRDTVANQIQQGMLGDHHGITSSTALSIAATPAQDAALGFALASDLSAIPFNFSGQTVSGDDVLVMFTWKADANLDGAVNVADLGILATNFGHTSGVSWVRGDFNGDGIIDVADLGILATNYGRGQPADVPLMDFQNALQLFPQLSALDSVPEPASLGFLGLGAAGHLARRRRCFAEAPSKTRARSEQV